MFTSSTSVAAEIRKDVEAIIRNGKPLGKTTKEGIKYFTRTYTPESFTDPTDYRVLIYGYDPSNHILFEGWEGASWERDLKKEKAQFERLDFGVRKGLAYGMRYYETDLEVKPLGGQKFICYDGGRRYTFARIYSTFYKDLFITFSYTVYMDADDVDEFTQRSNYVPRLKFIGKGLEQIERLERIISDIRW
ncbi:hypothetical protein ACFL1W_01190 [Candidatus Margulisiibacteriota bacterium]